MITNYKKILLFSGIIAIIIIIIFIKNFLNQKNSNQISYNELLAQNEDENKISNTENSIETIKVHITGEINNPRTYRIRSWRKNL